MSNVTQRFSRTNSMVIITHKVTLHRTPRPKAERGQSRPLSIPHPSTSSSREPLIMVTKVIRLCAALCSLAHSSTAFLSGTLRASPLLPSSSSPSPLVATDVTSTAPSLPLCLPLYAKKSSKQKKTGGSKKKANKYASTSGFGGAATAPCPCGSGLGYVKCCGKLHKDASAFASATAEQVVRARYSAYAKREVDFIIGSTHPLNSNFMSDIEHWKETIKMNCYDNFELTSCEIVSESYEGEGEKEAAKVKFIASMTQVDSREKTAFMETSTFERAGKHIANGAWLYKEGFIESAPGMPEPKEEEEDENVKSEEVVAVEADA